MGAEKARTWWILFLVSLILIIVTAVLHTSSSISFDLETGRVVTQDSPIEMFISFLAVINWILLPLSVIMVYTSLGKEKRWYEMISLYGFATIMGVFYLINSSLSVLGLGIVTQNIIGIFLTKFLYLTFVPLLIILFFSLFESVRIIKKLG